MGHLASVAPEHTGSHGGATLLCECENAAASRSDIASLLSIAAAIAGSAGAKRLAVAVAAAAATADDEDEDDDAAAALVPLMLQY